LQLPRGLSTQPKQCTAQTVSQCSTWKDMYIKHFRQHRCCQTCRVVAKPHLTMHISPHLCGLGSHALNSSTPVSEYIVQALLGLSGTQIRLHWQRVLVHR